MLATATCNIVPALASLGDATQIEMILIAKASMEDNISLQYRRCYHVQTSPMYMSLKQH